MAQEGDTRIVNGVKQIYYNGRWFIDPGEMDPSGGGLSGNYVGTGQTGAIGSVLGSTGPTESPAGKAAIDRLQNQADRKACNDSGGFYTMGGECLSGEEAQAKVNEILNNPNAPSVLVQNANAWVERNTENEDAVDPQEQELIDKWGKEVVDDAKEKYDEILKTIGASAKDAVTDPIGSIKKIISKVSSGSASCTKATNSEWVRDCVTLGVLYGIPGLPLPPIPGVMGATIGELEDAMKEVGASVQDILDGAENCGEDTDGDGVGNELCTWEGAWGRLKDWVVEKADEALPDFTDPDDIAGWLKDLLGDTIGAIVLSDIGDQLEDLFFEEEDPDKEDTELIGGDPCLNGDPGYEINPETGECVEVKNDPPPVEEDPQAECEKDPTKVWNEDTQACDDKKITQDCGDNQYLDENGECQDYAPVVEEDKDPPSSIDQLCSGSRPTEYGFEQINWDKYCGGDTPSFECPEGQEYDASLDQCVDKEELKGIEEEEEEETSSGGGGGGGGGEYESKILGLNYQDPGIVSLFNTPFIDSVAELNGFIARQAQRRNKKDDGLFS